MIAVGTVHTSEYEDREGAKRSSLEMRATAVGPDLARVIARIEQPGPSQNSPVADASGDAADGEEADSEELALGAPA